ncbi:MAG: baeRF3 domain-containing protein [Luteibaculaceae bacterium]
MKNLIKLLTNTTDSICISILVKTHRTKPDYLSDSLRVKNSIKEVHEKLHKLTDKRTAEALLHKLNELESNIDYGKGTESLALFISESVQRAVKLTVPVVERVEVSESFLVRDLIKNMQFLENYFIITLSRDKVRLFEVHANDQIYENVDVFPLENTVFKTSSSAEESNARRVDTLTEEFFSVVDKFAFDELREFSNPVLLACDENNYHMFKKISRLNGRIENVFIPGNHDSRSAVDILAAAKPLMQNLLIENLNKEQELIKKAISQGTYTSDINEILQAAEEGKVQKIFIEKGFKQPAIFIDNGVRIVSKEELNGDPHTSDIINILTQKCFSTGADVVFVPKDKIEFFTGVGAMLRF